MRAILWALLAIGCGGSSTAVTPKAGAPTPATPASAVANDDDEVPEPMKATVASAAPVLATDGSIVLENLFGASTKAADFPKASAKDSDCNKNLGFTGTAAKDYPELTAKCGTGTGMKEFVKTVTGSFGEKHPRDVYAFKMAGGFCYRFFAVADDTVRGIKIQVQRPEGALLSMAASKNFVAIMNPDGTWCKTKDREFRLVVESLAGEGKYSFGVWARPK